MNLTWLKKLTSVPNAGRWIERCLILVQVLMDARQWAFLSIALLSWVGWNGATLLHVVDKQGCVCIRRSQLSS